MRSFFCLVCFLSFAGVAWSQRISNETHNLRNNEPREWNEFPANAKKELRLTFQAKANPAEQTLRLRQYDVKQNWRVVLNNKDLGLLIVDEKDITSYFAIPKRTLRDGENLLSIKCDDVTPDDVRIQAIAIDTRPLDDLLTESQVEFVVTEKSTKKPLPCRLTILNAEGSLQLLKAEGKDLAVRPGCIYTANGHALFTLPAGKYTIYVNRGFEYGVEKRVITAKPSHRVSRRVSLGREVDTRGWTSSDTHIHTFTHSGHGDATDRERVITLAGEGIELAFITEHNKNIDLTSTATSAGVSQWFTIVAGTEVTTSVGHFNVFPIHASPAGLSPAGAASSAAGPINHQVDEWQTLSKNIDDVTPSPIIILNHARDVHNGFRPMDSVVSHSPKWKLPANAMEVLNSGSQQSDILQLFMDWQGLLNAGYRLTPVGSSDSHDVNRFIVGQGRVYIQSKDEDPGHINVTEAIHNLREGKVMVSAGLLTRIRVNNQYGPGDSVPYISNVPVEVWVEGPAWASANKIMLYVNGKKVGDRDIKATSRIIKWYGKFEVTIPVSGAFITAVALGPGNNIPFWPIAKPYQPTSPEWKPHLIGIAGAVWVEGQSKAK